MAEATPPGPSTVPDPGTGPLVGGLVAHNEEATLAPAVASLLRQELPGGWSWSSIWIVASGCTDRTVTVARRLAGADPRVHLIEEPTRRGKAVAIDRILERAQGATVVLLNADARAEPGAVAALLRAASGLATPFAVMGRPVAPETPDRPVLRATGLLWHLHHEFHLATLAGGEGNHLSDELLLVRLPEFAGLPEGVINDGSYVGAWLAGAGGTRAYAPEARVAIQVPGSWRDHLRQRRRIRFGHAQVEELLGTAPSTLSRLAFRDPTTAYRVLRRTLRGDRRRVLDLVALLAPELAAAGLSVWDRLPPRRDHVRWARIRRPVAWPRGSPP